METKSAASPSATELNTPYSLGKLIEWKRETIDSSRLINCSTPYSLGKLIEWKLIDLNILDFSSFSLLVREIN